jgi:hypothetical protein
VELSDPKNRLLLQVFYQLRINTHYMFKQKSLLILSLIVLSLLNGRATPVFACTPTPQGTPPYTLADKVNSAPLILEGIVAKVERDSWQEIATVNVLRYYKGTGPAKVVIGNFGDSSMCLTTVSVDEHAIFYASGDPYTHLRAYYRSAFAAVSSANANAVAEIIAITGAPTAPQGTATTGNSTGSAFVPSGLGASIMLVVFAMVALIWRLLSR